MIVATTKKSWEDAGTDFKLPTKTKYDAATGELEVRQKACQKTKDAKAAEDPAKAGEDAAKDGDAKAAAIIKGKSGFKCAKAADDCGADTLCCGEAKKTGETTAKATVCHTKTLKKWTDADKVELEFACLEAAAEASANAVLAASAALVGAAMYMQ